MTTATLDALRDALSNDDFSTINALIGKIRGTSVIDKALDGNGRTPLMTAILFGCSWMIVARLLSAGADVNVKNTRGRTAFHEAVRLADDVNTDRIVKVFIDFGAPLDAIDDDGLSVRDMLDDKGYVRMNDLALAA